MKTSLNIVGCFAMAVLLVPGLAPAQEATRNRTQMDNTENRAQWNSNMMRSRVEDRLANSVALAGSDIQVEVNNDTVVLNGVVADESDKTRARMIALRIPGVNEVTNNLRIDKGAVDARINVNIPDEQLAKNVAQKLATDFFSGAEAEESWLYGWEVDGNNFEFAVDVDNGEVQLDGTIPSRIDRSKLLQTVRTMPGVKSVESALRLPNAGFYDTGYGYGPYYGYYPYGPYWNTPWLY